MTHTTNEREVMPVPLPNWKDLVYEQLDIAYQEFVYNQIARMAEKDFTTATLDTFILNVTNAATRLNTVRVRVESEP